MMALSRRDKGLIPKPLTRTPREKRRSARVECRFPVSIVLLNGWSITAWTQNMSPQGLFVEYSLADSDGYNIKKNDCLKLVLNSPFMTSEGAIQRLYNVVDVTQKSDSRGLLRLELADDASREFGLGGYTVIRPADYLVPDGLEMEFLKTQELLDLKLPDERAKLVVVTSAQEGAGVSTFSWWFASCLARMADSRVLFIDGNLRQREVGEEPAEHVGLLNVLRGQCNIADAVIDLGSGCPRILDSGNAGDYLSGEVSAKMVKEVFDLVRDHFDYVIIDTLPVNTSPFTLMLAREADGTLLVIENRKTGRDTAREGLDLLKQVGCNVLGAVLNRV